MTNDQAKAWIEENGATWEASSFKLRLKDGRFVRAGDLASAVDVAIKRSTPVADPKP